jgi:hypothetical protein
MRYLIFVIALCLVISCSPEPTTPAMPVDFQNFDPSTATFIGSGEIMGAGGHTADGVASLYKLGTKLVVVLDPYESQNGPDLKVYLSKDVGASSFIRVGNLKATSGKQIYEVPGNPDETQYPFVHVWCEQYSVEFARAALN